MKKALPTAAVILALFAGFLIGHSQTNPAQTLRVPQFDNEEVKVWKTTVMPSAPLQMHRHEHPRAIIPLVGGTMKIVEQGGKSETHNWEQGHAYWLSTNPPNTMHADVNAGDKPIVVMVVELEKVR